MDRIATHSGIVSYVQNGRVTVKMQVGSACASCEAHAKCGFAESKEKEVVIDTTHWKEYQPGDDVTVIIDSNQGLRAVLIAYIFPALLFLATFITLYCLHVSEGLTALVTILIVALYAVLLYRYRSRLQKRFSFQLEKKEKS